jgi:hypothetical protein
MSRLHGPKSSPKRKNVEYCAWTNQVLSVMTFVIPPLGLAPGRIICLQIPRGFHEAGEAIEGDLQQFARRQSKEASIAQPAGFGPGIGETKTCRSWLSRVGGISELEAGKIIAGLGIRVPDEVVYNAGTSRSLLGIAATLIREPEVLIYSVRVLDVEGCRTVHRFVASRCGCLCVVHVSYPSVFGDGTPHPRDCPPNAECVELIENSLNSGDV